MMEYKLAEDKLGYYRCEPIPSKDELDRIYSMEYYTDTKPKLIERQEDDIDWWNAMFDDRLIVMSEIHLKSDRKMWPLMLDVGCGGGFFLRRAREKGWVGVGVEPNIKAMEYALETTRYFSGGIFYESSLENVKETRFWGIHMSEVLEHIPNPLNMLHDCHDRLLPGGSLCVVVPNEKLIPEGLAWPHVFQPPHHINYFDFDSLEALMITAGFEIYERSAMYPMETFLMMGLDYTSNESIGRLCHHHRMAFDMSMRPEQRRKFYKELAANKMGRECVIYAVKK
jgi:SAM-dependent methyltransferase